VPAGVQSITVIADGAQAGAAAEGNGGLGGETQAALTVAPGDAVEMLVGGRGGNGNFNGGAGSGGFNGGGKVAPVRRAVRAVVAVARRICGPECARAR